MPERTENDQGVEVSRAHRWLAPASLVIVALAAVMGWAASFVGLHDYGHTDMAGFGFWTAWLLPATFDGAAFACTLMTYRSAIHGRSALRGRILMWAFTAVSAWINWIHQPSLDTRLVAAGLPVAAVAVFDVVLAELRADYETRHGRRAFRMRPGLLLLRWLVDRPGTTAAFRSQVTAIPVTQLAALGTNTTTAAKSTPVAPQPREPTPPEPEPAPAAPAESASEPVLAGSVKLPPVMVDKVRAARDQAAREGRELTPADVHQVVKVSDDVAARIVAEFASRNGHALT